MHVIPFCEGPSFCTTDASSHTGNARLEPHIGNAGESVAGILTEKSLVTSFFLRNSSDRPPASDSRGALSQTDCGKAYPGILPIGAFLPCFGHQLDRLS